MILKKFKLNIFIVILSILIVTILPNVVADPDSTPANYSNTITLNSDLNEIFDEYLILIDYNEPMNPYILMNYYYHDGSCTRMVYGIKSTNLNYFNLDLEKDLIPVYGDNNKIHGYGVRTKSTRNLFIFVETESIIWDN
jgi:hypothetical protein